MSSNPKDLRAQLEELQAQLAVRDSTAHYARAGAVLVVVLMLAGAAAKLFWDSIRLPFEGVAAALVAGLLALYAVVQLRHARRLDAEETERFERLVGLRRALRLDDPSAFLPR